MNSMIIDHGHHHHCHNHSPTLGHQDCLSDVDANPAKRKPNCRNSHIAKSTVHVAMEHPDVGYNVIQYRSYQHSAAKFANITISPHNISIVHPNLVFAKSTLYLIFFNVYEIHYKAQIIGFKWYLWVPADIGFIGGDHGGLCLARSANSLGAAPVEEPPMIRGFNCPPSTLLLDPLIAPIVPRISNDNPSHDHPGSKFEK